MGSSLFSDYLEVIAFFPFNLAFAFVGLRIRAYNNKLEDNIHILRVFIGSFLSIVAFFSFFFEFGVAAIVCIETISAIYVGLSNYYHWSMFVRGSCLPSPAAVSSFHSRVRLVEAELDVEELEGKSLPTVAEYLASRFALLDASTRGVAEKRPLSEP